jgi:hypothetical protein
MAHIRDQDAENFVRYVGRSLEEEGEFHFLKHEFLHRLNITQLGVKLARLKSQIKKGARASEEDLNLLQTTLRDYGMSGSMLYGTKLIS